MNRAEKYIKGEHEEYFDPDPVELPIGYEHPETIREMIARMVRDEGFRQAVKDSGIETFEEANDLDPDGEPDDFQSRFEVQDMARDTFSERYMFDEERGEYVPREQEDNQSEPAEEPVRSAKPKAKVSKKSKVNAPVEDEEEE